MIATTDLLRGRLIFAFMLLTISQAWAGIQTPENTRWIGTSPGPDILENANFTIAPEQVDQEGFGALKFGVSDRNIWGSSVSSYHLDWGVSQRQWNSVFGRPPRARLGVGQVIEECVLDVCAKAGAAAGIELETYFLPFVKVDFDPGTFDATVAYKPSVEYQNSGLGTDFVRLNTRDGFLPSSSEFKLDAPTLKFETGVNIETNVNLFAEACLLGCFLDETYNLAKPKFKLPLVTLNTAEPEFTVFKPDLNRLDEVLVHIGDLIDDPQNALTDAAKQVLYIDAVELLDGTAVDPAQVLAGAPISVDFNFPYDADGATAGWSNGQASAQIGGELLAVSLDVDQVLGYAFGFKDGAKFSLDDLPVDTDPVSGTIELGDAKAGPVIDLVTDVSLTPNLMVDLEFDSEVLIRGQIGKQTSYSGTWEDLPEIALTADSNILYAGETPEDKTVTATPTFSVDATVANRTYLDIAAQASLELLSVDINIEGDGLPGLEFGPVLKYKTKSESLFEVDLFNDSFSVNDWTVLDSGIAGNEVDGSGEFVTASKSLDFNGFGEIVFQARAEGGPFDTFYDDDARIDQDLTSNEVITVQRNLARALVYTTIPCTSSCRDLYVVYLNSALSVVFDHELKIENRAVGHIMQDGLFTNQTTYTFTVENGGSLELGKDNPFSVRSLASEYLAAHESFPAGVVNDGVFRIYGEVYSNAGIENDGFALINNSKTPGVATPQLIVGANGWLKLDGKLDNQGFLFNHGLIENTAENSESSGALFVNYYGGEIDLHGAFQIKHENYQALINSGTVTLFKGAELDLERLNPRNAEIFHYAGINNRGELNVENGAELRIVESTSGAGLGHAAELRNLGSVSNSGYVLNETGQIITNGGPQLAFDRLLDDSGDWRNGEAMNNRNAALVSIEDAQADFLIENEIMDAAAADYRNKRLLWLTGGSSAQFNALTASINQLAAYRDAGGIVAQAADVVEDQVVALADEGFGVWENHSGGLLVNEGSLSNHAVLVNHVGASTYNSDSLDNRGYLQNAGQLVNQAGGVLANTGRVDNGNPLIGLAGLSELVNVGTLENRGEVINHDTVNNFGSIVSRDDGTRNTATTHLENKGSLANLGTLDNRAEYTNARGAETNNYGAVENTGVINNHGFFNNGVQGTDVGQSDLPAQINDAQDFYASIQALQKGKQNLENVNQRFENESVRQALNGFMGTVDTDSANAWATFLYEKYLVSNLAGDQEFADPYGPNQGSLARDREFIRNEVLNNPNRFGTSGCATNMLQCYKAYYGWRKGDTSAIDYNFAQSGGDDNTGIQAIAKYNDSRYFENQAPDPQEDENRFEWTLLMMMEAEGLNIGALDCIRNSNCSTGEGLNGGEQQTRKSFYLSYGQGFFDSQSGEQSFTPGDINHLEALYARWVDKAFFESNDYSNEGKDLSLLDVSAFSAPAQQLVDLYKQLYSSNGLIASIAAQVPSPGLGFNGVLLPPLDNVSETDVRALLGGLGAALRSASFDLAGITSVEADLSNTGTFNNFGVVNNSATITNDAGGIINNSGILMVGQSGRIDNDGDLNVLGIVLDSGLVDADDAPILTEQDGLLISNGLIENHGLIEISSGLLMNGTFVEAAGGGVANVSDARIDNSAAIRLSARIGVDDNGASVFNNALLVNNATLTNADGGLVEIGGVGSADFNEGKIYSTNTLRNYGDLVNESGAALVNRGTLFNAGEIENKTGSAFTSTGLLNNAGLVTFADSVVLGGTVNNGEATPTGAVINNGRIVTAQSELLTLTGNIAGSGEFEGDTLLQNATVSPGNSAGLLTFNGDVEFDGTDLMLEIWGTDRGLGYDAIDITGSLMLSAPSNLNIFSYLEFDDMISGQAFNLISVGGDLLDASGAMFTETSDFAGTMTLFGNDDFGGWEGAWAQVDDTWNLFFEYTGAKLDYEVQYRELLGAGSAVPVPGALTMFLPGVAALLWGRRRRSSDTPSRPSVDNDPRAAIRV